jgi:hypothetical protein
MTLIKVYIVNKILTLDKEAAANTAYTTRYDNHQYDKTNYDWCPSEK